MRSRKVPDWKYRELVVALGGDHEVAERIRTEGFDPPPPKTIAGWRIRNAVPGRWAPLLIDLALRDDRLDTVAQLYRRRHRAKAAA